MNSEIIKFFKELYEPGDVVCLTTMNDEGKAYPKDTSVKFSTQSLKSFFKKSKRGQFFQPNPGNGKRGEGNVTKLRCLFLDKDDGSLNLKGLPEPSYVFRRDENHHHIYYFLKGEKGSNENKELYKRITSYLTEKYNFDPLVCNPSGLLRIPGTEQHKRDEGGTYQIYKKSGVRYSLKELAEHIIPETEEKKEKQKKEKQKKEKPKKEKTQIDDDEIKEFLISQYERRGIKSKGEGRSQFLFFVGLDCHKWGIEQDNALEWALTVNEKFCDPPESEEVVHHQVESAYKYSREPFGAQREKTESDPDEEFNRYKNNIRIRDLLKHWVFVASIDRLVNLKTGMEFSTLSQIDNYIAHLCNTDMRLRTILKHELLRVVERIDFRPDIAKRIFGKHGDKTLNRFTGLTIYSQDHEKQNKKAIRAFTDHLRYLSTTDYEYEMLLNIFSYIVQNPGKKLDYATLIISKHQGIGKSILEVLFSNMFRSVNGVNYVGALENEQLAHQYTHFLADKIMIFVHELSQGDKYSTMNRFKNLITEKTVEINGKYAKPYTVVNTVNFFLFANDMSPIRIDRYDRRIFAIYNDKEPQPPEYYEKLYEIFRNHFIDIFNFLSSRDISNFNPHVRPELTEGKKQIIELSESELNLYLKEQMEQGSGPFKKRAILVNNLLTYCQMNAPDILKNRISVKGVRSFLLQNDYQSTTLFTRINGKQIKRSVWCRPGEKPGKLELGEMIEEEGIENF